MPSGQTSLINHGLPPTEHSLEPHHSPFLSAAAIYQSWRMRGKPLPTPAIAATGLRHEGCLSPLGVHLSDVVSERFRTWLEGEEACLGRGIASGTLLGKSCQAQGSSGQGKLASACCEPRQRSERPQGSSRARTRSSDFLKGLTGCNMYIICIFHFLCCGPFIGLEKGRENVKSKVTLRTGARTRLT